jgi:hypothetical protein
VDLVPFHREACRARQETTPGKHLPVSSAHLLLAIQDGSPRQKAQARGRPLVRFRPSRIFDDLAQHLVPATDAQQRCAAVNQFDQRAGQPALMEAAQVLGCVLTAGQHQQVRRAELLRTVDPADLHTCLNQGVEIVVISQMRQSDGGDPQSGHCLGLRSFHDVPTSVLL